MGPILEECKSCYFYEAGARQGVGHCKRFPPTIPPDMVIPQPKPAKELTAFDFDANSWLPTIVSEDDWCGEHKLR